VITVLKMIRARYRDERIWVVQDSLSSHWTTEVRSVARQLGITLVATPTYASWMTRIECHFGVMVKAVFAGSDYRDHAEIQAAVAAYLRPRPGVTGCSAGRLSRPIAGSGWPTGAFEPPPDRPHSIASVNIPDRAKSDLERRLEAHRQSR
jgi:hypothetical protein